VNTPFENQRQYLAIYDPSNKPLQQGDLLSSNQTSTNPYDLVVLSEVLEHIPFPEQTIREIRPYMSKQTLLYIETPFEKLQRNSDGSSSLAARKKH
jgi:2-polyprenyl-3-methyl-5-hydroxy-6-metoxy-1,4-benzoquinol methylase